MLRHNSNSTYPYLSSSYDDFAIHVSHGIECRTEDISKDSSLELLIESEETGPIRLG